MKQRNYVHKHALRFQKSGPMKDRKKELKRGKQKHKKNLTKSYRKDGSFFVYTLDNL